jgi:hypothetical protein
VSTGVDMYDDPWQVERGTKNEIIIDAADKSMWFCKNRALTFAAAILDEAGEHELAKMARDKVKT